MNTGGWSKKAEELKKGGLKHGRWQRLRAVHSILTSVPIWKLVVVLEVRCLNGSPFAGDWQCGDCGSGLSCGSHILSCKVAGLEISVILNKYDVWYVWLLLKLCFKPHTLKPIQRDGEMDQCDDTIDDKNMEFPLRGQTQE